MSLPDDGIAVKNDVLLGAINNAAHPLPLLLLVSIVAGSSERLLPNLIRQLEGTLVAEVGKVEELPGGASKGEKTPAPRRRVSRSRAPVPEQKPPGPDTGGRP
jgi:hypothetical protein